MTEGSLDAKGAVHLQGASGMLVYPAAQVKLDTTEEDDSVGGLVWSFFFPADAMRSLGPSATLEIDMKADSGRPFSLTWLNRLHHRQDVVLQIEGEQKRVAPAPWKGGPLPVPHPLTPQQEQHERQQHLHIQKQKQQLEAAGLVKPEKEVIIDPYKNESSSLWLLLLFSGLGVGGVWLISRLIMKHRRSEKSRQRDTEFGRFDLLGMEDRHVSDFDDDDV
ncbi:uncharacterized protein LOC113146623 [Cyclospora cayetanensis]|uniref:Uncharacterized protein LOC113146623 n=1 Tax=Cyclospora cayetanensis TaxID=88456 RepID=A0A6P6RS67_9EIME|nr:uncharacterized protein LOC113146623 [Cyclospora cayetanensis]